MFLHVETLTEITENRIKYFAGIYRGQTKQTMKMHKYYYPNFWSGHTQLFWCYLLIGDQDIHQDLKCTSADLTQLLCLCGLDISGSSLSVSSSASRVSSKSDPQIHREWEPKPPTAAPGSLLPHSRDSGTQMPGFLQLICSSAVGRKCQPAENFSWKKINKIWVVAEFHNCLHDRTQLAWAEKVLLKHPASYR